MKYRIWNDNVKSFESWHTINQKGLLENHIDGLMINTYTHKIDCNKKPIYEEDILCHKLNNRVLGVVKFNNETLRYEIFNKDFIPLSDYSSEEIKIIGNVYENNQLIKEGGFNQ